MSQPIPWSSCAHLVETGHNSSTAPVDRGVGGAIGVVAVIVCDVGAAAGVDAMADTLHGVFAPVWGLLVLGKID